MDIGDWITLSAVIVALGIGTASIIHTNILQRKERRERLLNEIIEWAEDVAESALRRQTMEQITEFYETKMGYRFSKAKSSYISEIVSISFDDLSPFLKNVIRKLDETIDIIARYMKIEKQASLRDLRNSEKELTDAVEELFEKAAKIKLGVIK